ncbi:MAG: sensor histidine kinase [Glaciihabitans sp.]|nr:sensor histidine kinase [Glaciihabitans sp.]
MSAPNFWPRVDVVQAGESMAEASSRSDRARQRDRLVRSIAQSQLLTSAALLLLAIFAVAIASSSLTRPLFFGGIAIVFIVTGLAVLVPWTVDNKHWAISLPILDIVAIVAIRQGVPELGAGLFLVFPVIWMARNYRLFGAIVSVALSTLLLWLAILWGGDPLAAAEIAELVLLPVTLAFISASIYSTTRRTTSQRVLLRSQATLTEAAFARARSQERSLEEILNAVEFGVLAFNAEGQVTLVNDAHRRSLAQFGAPRSALVHPSAYQFDRITPYPEATRPFERAIRGQAFEDLTLWVGEPGQERVAFSVTSRGLTDSHGDADGGVLVLRDVTAELDAIQARDDLVASVSHELRTPLTSILGYLELALDDPKISPDTYRMVDVAHRNSERLLTLVTDLLLAASDAEKTLPLTFEPFELSKIVQYAIDDQATAAEKVSVSLRVDIDGPVLITADPLRIRQVIDNLLSNAIKYNRPGGSVTIRVETNPTSIKLSVVDTGVGLTPDEQSHIFDKFYRTDSARQSDVEGSGLGMSITREIIRRHGGDLTLESEMGVGSTFSMTLPTTRRS